MDRPTGFGASALVGAAVVLGVSSVVLPGLTAVFAIIVTFGCAVVVLSDRSGIIFWWPLTAILFPLGIAFADSVVPFLPTIGDAAQYDRLGWTAALYLRTGEIPPETLFTSFNVRAYSTVVGFVYAFAGHNTLAGVALNCGFWGLAHVYWLRVGRRFVGDTSDNILGPLLVISPAGTLYTALLLREAVVFFLLSYIVWRLVRLFDEGSVHDLFAAALVGLVLVAFRDELLAPIFLGVLFGLAYHYRVQIKGRLLRLVVLGAVIVRSLLFLNNNTWMKLFFLDYRHFEQLRQQQQNRPHPYLVDLAYTSNLDVLLYLPVRVFYLLFSPFPWQPSNYELFIVTVDAAYILLLVAVAGYTLYRFRSALVRPDVIFLASYACFLVAGYGLIVSDRGAASRRRLFAVPVLLLIASYGLARFAGVVQLAYDDHRLTLFGNLQS